MLKQIIANNTKINKNYPLENLAQDNQVTYQIIGLKLYLSDLNTNEGLHYLKVQEYANGVTTLTFLKNDKEFCDKDINPNNVSKQFVLVHDANYLLLVNQVLKQLTYVDC